MSDIKGRDWSGTNAAADVAAAIDKAVHKRGTAYLVAFYGPRRRWDFPNDVHAALLKAKRVAVSIYVMDTIRYDVRIDPIGHTDKYPFNVGLIVTLPKK